MARHTFTTQTKERTVTQRDVRFICSCGFETDHDLMMDAHLHWELAEHYREALQAIEGSLGGDVEGLQRIARAALEDPRMRGSDD